MSWLDVWTSSHAQIVKHSIFFWHPKDAFQWDRIDTGDKERENKNVLFGTDVMKMDDYGN